MIEWDTWATQLLPLPEALSAEQLRVKLQHELAPHKAETRAEALTTLAIAMRANLGREVNDIDSERIVQVLRLAEEAAPGDPHPPMILASHLHYDRNDPGAALVHSKRAVANALRERCSVRQCASHLARICVALGRYGELEQILRLLINYIPEPSALETPLEGDFLAKLPAGSVSEETLREYSARLTDPPSPLQ